MTMWFPRPHTGVTWGVRCLRVLQDELSGTCPVPGSDPLIKEEFGLKTGLLGGWGISQESTTGSQLSLPAWHPSPCPAPLLSAKSWLVAGICSVGLDASASRPEICAELATKTWAPGRRALWELAERVKEPGFWPPLGKGT